MADVLVEQDPQLMTDQDLAAVLHVLDGIAVQGEGTSPRRRQPTEEWTLELHWQQRGPVSADTEAALPEALLRIREHYALQDRPAPVRLRVLDPDGAPLLRVDPADPGAD
jgi:hypothetical protein